METKDELYYLDLVYLIKGLASLTNMDDPEINQRIIIREQFQMVSENGHTRYEMSEFSKDLLRIINEIAKLSNATISNFSDISNYPDAVLQVIADLNLDDMKRD